MKQSNDYVCPVPKKWNEIYIELIKVWERCGKNLDDKPPVPLILAAWHETSDDLKKLRWKDTIYWAEKHNVAHLIPAMKDEDKFKG